MNKKVIIVFILALGLQFVTSCNTNCRCSPVRDIYYTNSGVTVKNLDSKLPVPFVTTSKIIAGANYGIQIELQIQQLVRRKQNVNWGLIQSAYACSCIGDNYLAKESILSVEIFSNNDFSSDYPKNTDLSSLFKIKANNSTTTIEEHTKLINNHKYGYPNLFYGGVFLQVKPSVSSKHEFKIRITLSDGRILEGKTTEVELT